MNLIKSTVYRGGVSSSNRVIEDTNIVSQVNWDTGSLGIHFSIASKGGGKTAVAVVIEREDLEGLIAELAQHVPRFTETLLSGVLIAQENDSRQLNKMEKDSILIEDEVEKSINDLNDIELQIEREYIKSNSSDELESVWTKMHELKSRAHKALAIIQAW